jgi:hypothetical protein
MSAVAELRRDLVAELRLTLPPEVVVADERPDTAAGPTVTVAWRSTSWGAGPIGRVWTHRLEVEVLTGGTLTAAGHYPRRDELVAEVLEALTGGRLPTPLDLEASDTTSTIGGQPTPSAVVAATYTTPVTC